MADERSVSNVYSVHDPGRYRRERSRVGHDRDVPQMKPGKRIFDFAGAALGLSLLWPVFLVVALHIKVDHRGPVFFRQERIGRGGKPFRIWKFRSMVTEAENRDPQLTVGEDPRITRTGRWLRRLKLDELPQLFNVLSGDMSLVGPRPEVPKYVILYDASQRRVLDLFPGITDPASLEYRDEGERLILARDPERVYVEEIMPAKIRLNLQYAENATVWSDFVVILKTLTTLLGIAIRAPHSRDVSENRW